MANESLHAAEFESVKGQVPSETIASATTSADTLVSALTMVSFELTVCTHQTPRVACDLTAPGSLVASAESEKPSSISRTLDIGEDQEIVLVSYEPLSGLQNLLYFTYLKASVDGRSVKVSAASVSNRADKKITLTIKVLVAKK